MSYLKTYEALNSQFAKISEVVHSIKQKEENYTERLKQWLLTCEALLKSFNFKESLEIAGYRGQLIVTEYANTTPNGNFDNNSDAILELIAPAKDTMISVISPVEERIRTSESIIKELLDEQLELNLFSWNNGLNYRDFIHAVWRTLLKQNNTKDRAQSVKTLIGDDDALKLISNQIKIN